MNPALPNASFRRFPGLIDVRLPAALAWQASMRALAVAAVRLIPCAADAVDADDDGWEVTMSPYFWMTSLNGEITLAGQKTDIDASFQDILDDSDSVLAFNSDIQIRYNRFGLMLNPSYAQLGVDDVRNGRPLEADVTFDLLYVDASLFYRVVDWPMHSTTGGEDTEVVVDAYAGARYTWLETEVDFDNFGSPDRDRDWWDPILGAQSQIDLSRHWFLWMRSDLGGFGAGSDFTANGSAAIGYRFSIFGHGMAARAGYRVLFQDYDTDSGANRFEWDMTTHGPTIGLFSYWG